MLLFAVFLLFCISVSIYEAYIYIAKSVFGFYLVFCAAAAELAFDVDIVVVAGESVILAAAFYFKVYFADAVFDVDIAVYLALYSY